MIDLTRLADPTYVESLQAAAEAKCITEFDASKLVFAWSAAKQTQQSVEDMRRKINELSSSFKGLDADKRAEVQAEARDVGEKLAALEAIYAVEKEALNDLALRAPGIPDEQAPRGKSDLDNVEQWHWGEPRKMASDMVDHVELCKSLKLVDFESTKSFAGSRSYALTGNGALLARAVLDLALHTVVSRGYDPVIPPVIVRGEAMQATGYFPFGREETYSIQADELFLVGTSEVSLVSRYLGAVLDNAQLPMRSAGISTCFRREAGAAGRDTKGLYRVHQFEKIEQVVISRNDDELSRTILLELVKNAENVLQGLELPYRVALACTGDMGQGQKLKYEIETWMPSRDAYSETHSASAFGDFQARRGNIRYKDENGKSTYAHTLNNTAIAVPRVLIPILEHHQREDGTVAIPKALQSYLNGATEITPSTKPSELVVGR